MGALARKIKDCAILPEDCAADWLGVLKKRELWCSYTSKGVIPLQKSALLFSPHDRHHLFTQAMVLGITLDLQKKSSQDF